jgi:hypothetical protein
MNTYTWHKIISTNCKEDGAILDKKGHKLGHIKKYMDKCPIQRRRYE